MATKKTENAAEKQLKVTLVKSTIGSLDKHKKTVQALGLKKIRQSVVVRDNAAMRGMIFAVKHLVTVEEVQG
ncbi:50S ribosomal protein L30 [Pumilibacter intestinalis]|jgi:large subunit ribosomal protein L30|uniref:50S ribosomal protein L30 n=1 Tax=Pumilibacter intestinalis TaxID=2941511 RepID=UPI00203B66BD|nr:50S ribosomal protein L30 [Pumilibacter intestinalis]